MQRLGISVPRVRNRTKVSQVYSGSYTQRRCRQKLYISGGVTWSTDPNIPFAPERIADEDEGIINCDMLATYTDCQPTSANTFAQWMSDYTFHRKEWRSPEQRKRDWDKVKAFAKLNNLSYVKYPNLEWWYDYLFRYRTHHWPYQGCNSVRKFYPLGRPTLMLSHNPTWVKRSIVHGAQTYYGWHELGWDIFISGDSLLPRTSIEPDFTSVFMTKAAFDGWNLNGWSLDKLRRLASSAMIPDMEDGLSIPVFLAEWKDVPRMFRNLATGLLQIVETFKAFLSHPVVWWSQANLSANFGWLPFISDLKEMFERLMNLRKTVTEFIDNSSKLLTYHFRRSIDPLDIKESDFWLPSSGYLETYVPNESYVMSGIYSVGVNYQRRKEAQVEYHATAYFHYNVPYQGTFAKIFAALDRFGFNVSLSDVWEIVPFSFVVDWFLDIQSLIETLDFTNVPVQIVIHDFCDSISFDYAEKLVVDPDVQEPVRVVPCGTHAQDTPLSGWTVPPSFPGSEYHEHGYYRWTGKWTVDLTEFPQLRTPKGTQIVLLANLIATH